MNHDLRSRDSTRDHFCKLQGQAAVAVCMEQFTRLSGQLGDVPEHARAFLCILQTFSRGCRRLAIGGRPETMRIAFLELPSYALRGN